MGCAAEERSDDHPVLSDCDDGWYLLRRDASLCGKQYRAGTLVEHLNGSWCVWEWRAAGEDPARRTLPLDVSMICNTSYGSVSLYEIWRRSDGEVYARPVLSDVYPQSVDPIALTVVLAAGESRVCVRFGRCFLPLELFNW